MEKPIKKIHTNPAIDYHDIIDFIEDKYKIQVRDYKGKFANNKVNDVEYLDYWHWLINNHFYEVGNPCHEYFGIKEIIEDENTPDWAKEITQLIYDEFKDECDKEGGLEVYISW